MKLTKVGIAALTIGLALTVHRAEASLVTYDFEGTISHSDFDKIDSGSAFSGTLSFDPSQGTPTGSPGAFDLPLLLQVNVGPYALTTSHTGPSGLLTLGDTAELNEMLVQGTVPPSVDLKTDLSFSGPDLFKNISNDSLDGANWQAVNLKDGDQFGWSVWDDDQHNQPMANGIFTKFAFVGGPGGGGNVAPVPEPASMALFGSGILGLIGSRFRKRGKKMAIAA